MDLVEKEGFRIKTKFSYSWLTNRIGNVWNIRDHPCQDAKTKQHGEDLYSADAFTNYAGAADVSKTFHTSDCMIPHVGAVPNYPCADSYPGFSDKIDLALCKCIRSPRFKSLNNLICRPTWFISFATWFISLARWSFLPKENRSKQ